MIQTTSRVRWGILAFLFVATAIPYIDRSALGILAPELQLERSLDHILEQILPQSVRASPGSS